MSVNLILVDKKDNPLGELEKIQAHKQGLLHRAFSIFIIDENEPDKMLLQKRNPFKYHSGNLWSNTCCSHPTPEYTNNTIQSAKNRLNFEMGLSCENLIKIGHYTYKHDFKNGIIEYEYDHILLGSINKKQKINPNPEEVCDFKWIEINKIRKKLSTNPEFFTIWFQPTFNMVQKHLEKTKELGTIEIT